VGTEPEVAAYFHQLDFPDLEVRLARKEIFQTFGENRIGEKASPCRRRIIRDVQFSGKLHLRFSAPSREVQKEIPLDPSFFLRNRHLKKFSGKRSQDEPRETALGGHNGKGFEVLGHGPLPQDFAGDNKVRSFLFEQLAGFAKHEGMAVDTGIHVPAITVRRVFDHFKVGFGQINDFERKLNGL